MKIANSATKIEEKFDVPDADGDLVVAHGVSVDEGVELQLLLVVEDHLQELPVRVAWVSVSQNLSWSEITNMINLGFEHRRQKETSIMI